jgi:spoIIIJ-associated protein
MLDKKDLEKIKKETERFFEKMNFEIEIGIKEDQENIVSVNLKTEEPQILIGKDGQTLMDIQHLLKRILRKDLEQVFIDFDINEYKKTKKEYLKELAQSSADEVALAKKEKTLNPMSSYERRVIHIELSGRNDVETESIGEEMERRVVIKPLKN